MGGVLAVVGVLVGVPAPATAEAPEAPETTRLPREARHAGRRVLEYSRFLPLTAEGFLRLPRGSALITTATRLRLGNRL